MQLLKWNLNAAVGWTPRLVAFVTASIFKLWLSAIPNLLFMSAQIIASMLHASLPEYLILWSVTHLASPNENIENTVTTTRWYYCTVDMWCSASLHYKHASWSGTEIHFNFFIPWIKLVPSVSDCHRQGPSSTNRYCLEHPKF